MRHRILARLVCSLMLVACGLDGGDSPAPPADGIAGADGVTGVDGVEPSDVPLADVPGGDDTTTGSELGITFVKPQEGQGVLGLVEIELYAQAVGGQVASLVLTAPAGLVDQDAATEVFSAQWDSTESPDGPVVIEAKATDMAGHEVTASIHVTVTNHGAGQVSGTATLEAPLGGLPVAVATFDDFVVGAPIGAGTTAPDGTFSLAIAPPKPGGRVVVTIGDDVARATAVLQDGVASGIAVTGLTALSLDLAGRYHIDGMGTDEALSVASARLSEHFRRPETVNVVAALPAVGGALDEAATLSALFHAGLASLAGAHGDTAEALLGKLRLDLGDGLFDGTASGDMLNTNSGYVLAADTTRYELAQAVHEWLAAGGDAGEIDDLALAQPSGFYADVSLDDGPLYAPKDSPHAYDPFPPVVTFDAEVPADGAFVSKTLSLSLKATDNGAIASFAFSEPEGLAAAVGSGAGVLQGILDTSKLEDGPLTVTAEAADDTGNVGTASRTFVVDNTGPKLIIAAPQEGAIVMSTSFTLKGTALDEGSGVAQVGLNLGGFGCCAKVPGARGAFEIDVSVFAGPTTVGVTATDVAGNTTTTVVSYTVDAYGPDVVIDSPKGGALLGVAEVTVMGTAIDAVSDVKNVTASTASGSVTGPAVEGAFALTLPLAEGENDIMVSAKDAWDHETPEPPHVVVTVDTAGPVLTVDEPQEGAWLAAGPVSVQGTATDTPAGVAKVDLVVDDDAPVPATLDGGAWSLTLPGFDTDGAHQFTAAATDTLGATTTATVVVNIDATAPELSFEAPPPAWVATKSTSVAFHVAETGSGVASVTVIGAGASVAAEHVEGATWIATLPVEVGQNDFVATAADAVGNGSKELPFSIGVDFDAPSVGVDPSTFGDPKTHWIQAAAVGYTVTGTASDAASGVTGVTLTCNDAPYKAVVTPDPADPQAVTWTFDWTPELAALPLSCYVTATDAVGLTSNTNLQIFLLSDGVGPTVTDLSPAPGAWIAGGALTLTGTVTDFGGVGVAAVAVQGGGDAVVVGETFTVTVQVPAVTGPFEVTLVATDLLGNVSSEPAAWKVDATPPEPPVMDSAGLDKAKGPGGIYTKSPEAAVSCVGFDNQSGLSESCMTAEGKPPVCLPTLFAILVHPTPAGTVATCTVKDKVGNVGVGTLTLFKDDVPPVFTVETPADGVFTKSPDVTFTGTIEDAGVGPYQVTVAPAGGAPAGTLVLENGAWKIVAKTLAMNQAFVFTATDDLGNASTLTRTVNYDVEAPKLTLGTTTFMDEKNMTVTWSGPTPTYGSGPALTIGPSCAGKCIIRKYVTRTRYSSWADVAANNLPVIKLAGTDNGSKPTSLAFQYRWYTLEQPATAWRPIDDADDGAADGAVSVPWAVDAFTEGDPAAYVFDGLHLPNRLDVKATDAAGNVGTLTVELDVQPLAPPLTLSAMASPPADTFDIANYTLDGYTAHQLFGASNTTLYIYKGARMLVVEVKNPWDHPIAFQPTGGSLSVAAVVRRPYLAATTNTNSLCSSPKSCATGQCTYTWSDTTDPPPAGCVTSKTAKSTTLVWSGQGTVNTQVESAGGGGVAKVEGGWLIPAKGTLYVQLRAGLADTCLLGPATDVSYIHAGVAPIYEPFASTVKLYRWPTAPSCAAPGAIADSSHCMLNATCPGATYLDPLALVELQISTTAGGPLSLEGRVPGFATGVPTKSAYVQGFLYKTTSAKATALPVAPYSPY